MPWAVVTGGGGGSSSFMHVYYANICCYYRGDFESGRLGWNPEWGPIYYIALIAAQGLPEPSSFWGSTLSTRAAEHRGCN